jgi:hypothetical protein
MALEVDVNSYVDNAEATIILADILGASSMWSAETEPDLVLIAATQQIDLLGSWLYNKSLSTQLLEFPRNYEIVVPKAIKEAVCRVAIEITKRGGISSSTSQDLILLKAGPVQLNFSPTSGGTTSDSIFTDIVLKLIKPYRLDQEAVRRS